MKSIIWKKSWIVFIFLTEERHDMGVSKLSAKVVLKVTRDH